MKRLVVYTSLMTPATIWQYPDTLTLNNGNYFFSFYGNEGNYTVIEVAKASEIQFNSFGNPVMKWEIVRYDANSFQKIYTLDYSSTNGTQNVLNYYYGRIN